MPWEHCGQPVLDDQPCPACGVDKATWTLEWNATRTFKVTKRPIVRFELLGEGGEPVVDEPFAVTLPDGSVVEGRTDELGQGKVPSPDAGDCLVRLTARDADEVEVARDDDEAPPPETRTDDGFPTRTGRTLRLREVGGFELQLTDDEGQPIADVDFHLELPDGSTARGKGDAMGKVKKARAPEGTFKLTLSAPRPQETERA